MPCTVPVPKDYAQKYDKGKQSTYGEHQVFTGPYMIENDGKGNITGYKPGKKLTLVRNPSWDKDDRLQAGLLRPDRVQGRQRRDRRGPADARAARTC